MANLFPAETPDNIMTDIEATAENTVIGYKQSIFYDIESGQVLRDGINKVLTATGIEAWKQWCYNCLNTERYSCAAYPTDFGIETEKARSAETKAEAEAILTTQITEALLADPYGRTKGVELIKFNWLTADSVEIIISVQGIDDAKIDITTTLK